MLRSQRLAVVLSLEARKEQEALERMGEARKLVDQQRERVENLNRYQQEYRQQIRNSKGWCRWLACRPGRPSLRNLTR